MQYRVEVRRLDGVHDARGQALVEQAAALGINGVDSVGVSDLYFLEGDLDDAGVATLCSKLLCDPIVEEATFAPLARAVADFDEGTSCVEVALLPGVTDSVAGTLLYAAQVAGVSGLSRAASGQRYSLRGEVAAADLHRLASGLLANEVVQTFAVNAPVAHPLVPFQEADATVERVPLKEVDRAELEQISHTRRLSLNLEEMLAIQGYYRAQQREPTDLELEMLAQTWSEHCVHKTFRARITLRQPGQEDQLIESLLSTYIRGATEKVNKPWVYSAFVDNAGIVRFDDEYDLAFKVETHNHPSALEPFGGANTGLGGVVRDVIGVSARPIATTDVLCFGPMELPFAELPKGLLHPQRIAEGVIRGIEDYGNKMGIPTVNGAILYDQGYVGNPLVYCGCLGILPHDSHRTSPRIGDLVVVIGGNTGRDGLRGATFSSMEMDSSTGEVSGSAVQIGHPIMEKQTLEVVLKARDRNLYTAITDCGAGGLSSAVGEMAETLGASVDLACVPLKYPGLKPWEIWLSEAQERMVLAISPENLPAFRELCQGFDVPQTVLGTFTGDGEMVVRYGEKEVGRLSMEMLHHGIPRRELVADWVAPVTSPHSVKPGTDLSGELLGLLRQPDIGSKEDTIRRYDHEVQGGTVVKPLVGVDARGPGDAAVLQPLDTAQKDRATRRGVALSVGIQPHLGVLDPYAMSWAVVDEAMRNIVAVGADPDQVALLDNFCWGNPSIPDRLGSLVRCVQGCYDAAVAFQAPFVSGKDSLNNEYTGADGQKCSIPGTLLISAIGIVPDITRTVTMELKRPDDVLFVVGATGDELAGGAWLRQHGQQGQGVPQPAPDGLARMRALHKTIRSGLVRSCHDCSEGGLLVAVAEMSLAGGLGVDLDMLSVPTSGSALDEATVAFSESLSRFVVAVDATDAEAFERRMDGHVVARVGRVRQDTRFWVTGSNGQKLVDTGVDDLQRAFCI